MFYHLTLLAVRQGTATAPATVCSWVQNAPFQGRLLACWKSEIGVLGQILLLHCHEDDRALRLDHQTISQSPERYGIGDGLAGASSMILQSLPSFGTLQPGSFGPIFEVRSYLVRAGALAALIKRWERALPARREFSEPLIIMHSTEDADPWLVHIWPYTSFNQRDEVRAMVMKTGTWPPRGPPGILIAMRSEIFVPAPASPIR